jgi:hypothetical protein
MIDWFRFRKSKNQLSVCFAPDRFGHLGDHPLTNFFRSRGILDHHSYGKLLPIPHCNQAHIIGCVSDAIVLARSACLVSDLGVRWEKAP